ncbi:MAG: hypothetical protein HZB41_04470 [Ignavibacteriae bacterium]|nr:hypothetical protein [Ignavibacteriota bacterium]
MRYYIYILFYIVALFFISCNSTTSPTDFGFMSDYYPTSIGSWWKYENWVLDSNGTRTKMISIDSIVVEDTLYFQGKNAFTIATYSKRGDTVIKFTNYIALENSKIYAYLNLTYSDGYSVPWVKFADLSSNNWIIVEKNIIRDTLSIRTEFYEKISCSKGGIVDFNFKNQVLKTQEFITDYIQRTQTVTPNETTGTDMESINQDLYCKGVGLVHSNYMMLKNVGFERQGYETTLIDYYIK